MTSTEQPLLYVREGSRFVVYDERAQHVPPIPVPVSIPPELEDVEQGAERPMGRRDPEQPNRTLLDVVRCPHGSFEPWASRNCKGCARAKMPARRRT